MLPFPSAGDLQEVGIKLQPPTLQADSLPSVKAKLKNNKKNLYHTKTKPPTYLCHVKQRTGIKIHDIAHKQRVFYGWFQQQWEIWHDSVPAFKTQERKTACLLTRCRVRRQFWVAMREAFSWLLRLTLLILLFTVNYYLHIM